ncbi:MFS transporter [Nonomuraea sp. NPDC050540]|uniref:MFS transporter n=1 Tax=Nonomuraea sp. NPDC050540 TaxID=3364367 RepID=UPI0037985471
MTVRTTPARAGTREWIALAVLGVPAVLVMMNMSVLYLALPTLAADLAPDAAAQLWIMDIYGFMVAGFLIAMGTLGDRYGHRRLLLAGAAVFTAGSIMAAWAGDTGVLIAARAIQGVGAAALAPSSLAVIRRLFADPGQRRFAITVWMLAFMAGGALGPLVGGTLLHFFSWGSVFLVAVPAMVVLVAAAPYLLPEHRAPDARRIDAAGVVLSFLIPLSVVYGVKRFAADGLTAAAAGSLAAGVVLGVVFVRRQRRTATPLFDLSLFRAPAFAVSVGGMVLVGIVLFGTSLQTSQYLQMVLGYSPLTAGLWQLPTAVSGTVVALWVSGLAARVRPALLMSAGAVLALAGPVLLTQVDREPWFLVGGSVLLFAGLTPFMALGTGLVLGAAPPERAGAASAISETGAELGGALGIALLGSLAAAVYGRRLGDTLPPGLPPGVPARGDTLAETLHHAATLPQPLAGALAESARDAFTHGIHVHALALAPLLVLLAAVTPLAGRASAGVRTVRR